MKKIIKKLSKKITALILAISMLFTNIMPISTVFALNPEDKTDLVELRIRNSNGITINNGTATINYDGGTVTLTASDLYTEVDHNWNYGDHVGDMNMLYTTDTSITFNFHPEEGRIPRYYVDGHGEDIENNTYTMNNLMTFNSNDEHPGYDIEFVFEGGGGNGGNIPMPTGQSFQVDFGTASWNINGVTVTASIEGKDLTDGFLEVIDSDVIRLTNFDPETMEARVSTQGEHPFSTSLFTDNENTTCLAFINGNGVLPPEDLYFNIVPRGNPEGVYTVDFGDAEWEVDGVHVVASIEGKDLTNGPINITNDDEIYLEDYDDEFMEIRVYAQDGFNTRLFIDDNNYTCIECVDGDGHVPNDGILEFRVELRGSDGPEEPGNPPQEGNHTAIVRVNGVEGTYMDEAYNPDTGEWEEVERPYDGPGEVANETKFNINGGNIWMFLPEGETFEEGPMPWYLYNEIEYQYDEEEGDTTVDIGLYTRWDQQFSDTIRINNMNYLVSNYIDYEDVTSWVNHVEGEYVGFVITVPKAEDDIYEITVKIDKFDTSYVSEFVWTNDPQHKYYQDEEGNLILDGEDPIEFPGYIGNANIQLIGARFEFNNQTYNYTEADFSTGEIDDDYFAYETDMHTDYNLGHIYALANTVLTFRITPKPGYQITDFNVPGDYVTDNNRPNEYTFTIPANLMDFHVATEEIEDFETNNSENIVAGNLVKGNATELNGTTDFIISNSDLTNSEKQEFVDYAEGYTIREYFNLELNQVFFKGNSESAWILPVNNLRKQATINLQFANSIDYDKVVIIRKTGDNTFETINISTINRNLNRLSFQTKRFGQFALATKTLTEIDAIDINVEGPTPGTTVNVTMAHDDEYDFDYPVADITPVATADANAPFTIDSTAWVNGLCTSGSGACNEYFNGTFDVNGDYYAMISISSKAGYKLTYNSLDHITVNGRALDTSDGDEIFNIYTDDDGTNTYFIIKIHAAEVSEPEVKGDFNNNGRVDLLDIIYLLKRYLNIEETTAEDIRLGDMNNDNAIGLRDIILLLKEYLGV